MYEVYIICSINSNRYYIGSSVNAAKRLVEHNRGKTRSTKAYRPWKIVYTEHCNTKFDALKREQQIKSYKSGEAFKKLISSNGEVA